MLNERGRTKSIFFAKDSLHLNQKGYELWISIVKPILYDLYITK